MAIPQKRQGFRKITVMGIIFNWKFSGGVDVRPVSNKDNKLFIDYGWYDDWLYVHNKENKPPDYEPQIVTPNFVRKSIEFAIENGWNTENKTGKFDIMYKDGKYKLKLF
ncbi:hypothetical protein [uncultured Kordia sp.]|uniref:hypothetical protein n=1 Tax=uncultured Kordia sp. TaxID=507699 RepID=UPI002639A45D|nr:hypothetical protein [uncultured Kordia sp.]